MGQQVGYARVSSAGQSLDAQKVKLQAAGCERIYAEKLSGRRSDRPELAAMLDYVREGDVVTVTKLDRMARSMHDLIATAKKLEEKKVDLRVLDQGIDTTTPEGRMTFHILGAVSEFEWEIRKARIDEGVAILRAKGIEPFKGRPPKLRKEDVEKALADVGTKAGAAKKLGISRDSVYRLLSAR